MKWKMQVSLRSLLFPQMDHSYRVVEAWPDLLKFCNPYVHTFSMFIGNAFPLEVGERGIQGSGWQAE